MTSSSLKFWIENLDDGLLSFLNRLKKNEYEYYPVKSGLTKEGSDIKLGFSCFALKIKYILNDNDIKDKDYVTRAKNYLCSFQKNSNNFPVNSFIDDKFLYYHENFNFNESFKEQIKIFINIFNKNRFLDKKTVLKNYIRAETKQAISTIYQIGETNDLKYTNFPTHNNELKNFLDNQNWEYPWNAGAQFSTLCVFSKTQLDKAQYAVAKKNLEGYISKISNKETGAYFKGNPTSSREIINGAMKVLTGLDWLNSEIHYPEKLIDFCLNAEVIHEGCDIVDIVYVLYKCSQQTNYRKSDINKNLEELLKLIKSNFVSKDGAFSYFFEASQNKYYGLNISKGFNTADIHGSLLLLWALSMIFDVTEKYSKNWNILKP